MNKMIKKVALLAVLSVVAVGCQKETIEVPQVGLEETVAVYTVRYTVNGVTYTETLIGEQAWADFLQRMLALAEEGYRVMVSRNGNTSQYALSKDAVTFTTYNKEEAYAWLEEKLEEGYEVTIDYDPETGKYTCVAVK